MNRKEIEKQAEQILREMTLEEKLGQIQCLMIAMEPLEETMKKFPYGLGEVTMFGGRPTAKESMEMGKKIQEEAGKYGKFPPIMHGEAVTGLNSGEATIFPSAIGLGATWDPELVQEMADIIRRQMLAVGVRQALSPVMDVARDPRWGRVGETYGEDPTLCARMSVAFVKGLQSDELKNGVAATGKHFLGYGMGEGGLNMAANPIPARELREGYAKPFQAAITEAGLESIMNSYGSIDGELVIQSETILRNLLREEMDFQGIVVSDYRSVDKAVDLKVCADAADGGKRALQAGLDIELPSPFAYTDELIEAVRREEVSEELLDQSVKRILMTKIKLGLLENPYPREDMLEDAFDPEKCKAVSLKAARKATVLLKNDGVLPLKKEKQRIAIIGAHGDSIRLMFGCYTFPATLDMMLSGSMHDMAGLESGNSGDEKGRAGDGCYPGSFIKKESEKVTAILQQIYRGKTPTIKEAIKNKCPQAEVRYERGCDYAGFDDSGFQKALQAAKEADVVILCLGGKYGWGSNCTVGEGIDTDRIGLPGIQEELVHKVCETGVLTVMVHMDAKPLSSQYIYENCNAVLEYWFPGETGGEALADILFGDYNPAGRLPMTAAQNAGQIPIYASQRRGSGYSYSQTLGMVLCKYVEGTKQPLQYFGEGLSYTKFVYSDLQITPRVKANGKVIVSCIVENVGVMDGEEVVQLYVTDAMACMMRPYQELAGFARVSLKAGEKKQVEFTMKTSQFAFLDRQMCWVVEAGEMMVHIGASSVDTRLEGTFEIEDSAYVKGSTRGFYADVCEKNI